MGKLNFPVAVTRPEEHPLKKHFRSLGVSQATVALNIGSNQHKVSQVLNGLVKPSKELDQALSHFAQLLQKEAELQSQGGR